MIFVLRGLAGGTSAHIGGADVT